MKSIILISKFMFKHCKYKIQNLLKIKEVKDSVKITVQLQSKNFQKYLHTQLPSFAKQSPCICKLVREPVPRISSLRTTKRSRSDSCKRWMNGTMREKDCVTSKLFPNTQTAYQLTRKTIYQIVKQIMTNRLAARNSFSGLPGLDQSQKIFLYGEK